jgi:hypothetical protein
MACFLLQLRPEGEQELKFVGYIIKFCAKFSSKFHAKIIPEAGKQIGYCNYNYVEKFGFGVILSLEFRISVMTRTFVLNWI